MFVRLSLVLWAGGLLCACSAGGMTGSTGAGGLFGTGGTGGTGGMVIDDGGQDAPQDCPVPTCTCDAQTPDCQLMFDSLCVGVHCPPTIDQAMLVASWPLDPSTAPYSGRTSGLYTACTDGRRSFEYRTTPTPTQTQTQTQTDHVFTFDTDGRLAVAATFVNNASCPQFECVSPPVPMNVGTGCFGCEMYSDPPPAMTVTGTPGQSNGFGLPCEIDANGRWFMPYLDKTN
jgi:hypothetical protein